jgi:2-succinyl-5-enolpyruvyl-6-hydroxy-3-cyclohexene-1-carboxylate synthase
MSQPSGADVQAAFCAVLVDEWVRGGVTDAVIAPGSRSTPMVVALDADPRMRVHVVLDERCAGFVALGLGLASGRPAVLATTSGTASVELHPAVVEASYAGVPLIAVTADRPPELHHVGAPQTVEQDGLFGASPRWSVSPGVADLGAVGSWRSLGSRCVAEAGRGPVHVNLPFREPLLGSGAAVETPAGRPGGKPWHDRVDAARLAAPSVVDWLASYAGRRGLIVAGGGIGEPGPLVEAAHRLGWPVFADPRSGCRVPDAPGVIAAADSLLRVPEVAAWTPELVVRVGALWASKVLAQWLAALPDGVPQVLVDPWGQWEEPDRRAALVVGADPSSLASALVAAVGDRTVSGEWCERWIGAEAAAQLALESSLRSGSDLELSEPAVARATLASVPDGGQLVVSSSMPVRDVEWYGAPRGGGVRVLSNRGANGIDGVLSTAVGAALTGVPTVVPTVALLGDLAFLYDASALIGAGERDLALTVVVIDNDGGGIFSFLPQASALSPETFERYWGTPHGLDVGAVAAAYGADVVTIEKRVDLEELVGCSQRGRVRVGVVRTDRAANVAAHNTIHAAVAEAVGAAVSAP